MTVFLPIAIIALHIEFTTQSHHYIRKTLYSLSMDEEGRRNKGTLTTDLPCGHNNYRTTLNMQVTTHTSLYPSLSAGEEARSEWNSYSDIK